MAYKDSDELQTNENYALGEYSFRIERTSVPGSTNDQLTAICTQGGKNARKSIQIPSSQNTDGWYVEANENTATVYAVVRVNKGSDIGSDLDTGNMPNPFAVTNSWSAVIGGDVPDPSYWTKWTYSASGALMACYYDSFPGWISVIFASSSSGAAVTVQGFYDGEPRDSTVYNATSIYEYDGKKVYYGGFQGAYMYEYGSSFNGPTNKLKYGFGLDAPGQVAWTMIYGTPSGTEYETKQIMVGRFAIELEEAGGVGPGSDWNDPGDYDDGWEPGDPTYTLNVEIDGALSGRHNDPLNDTSYSYLPSDKATVKDYGCGGDGGNGGGGGGGASSIVVYKFATDKANWKEIVCKPKRHGYGSGGGKGGKGGDGCILIYY